MIIVMIVSKKFFSLRICFPLCFNFKPMVNLGMTMSPFLLYCSDWLYDLPGLFVDDKIHSIFPVIIPFPKDSLARVVTLDSSAPCVSANLAAHCLCQSGREITSSSPCK